MSDTTRARCFCFTLNNYSETEYENLKNNINYSYIIIGKEIGKENTPHLQGYIEFDNPKSFGSLKKINKRIHWEIRRGNQKQAIDYCKKDNNFIELGEKKSQGQRTDLDNVKKDLDENKGMRHISKNYNYQCIKFSEKWLTYNENKRKNKPHVTWIYGPSGSGKTRKAYEIIGENDVYEKDTTKWWDGYDKQDYCLLDDFRGKQMEFNALLKLLDRYAYRVEFKGGFRQFESNNIIITSINHPKDAYGFLDKKEPLNQLIRRIDSIIKIKTNDPAISSEDESDTEDVVDTEVGGNTIPPTSVSK